MLCLSRKLNERIVITTPGGEVIEVMVVRANGTVKLGITADRSVDIARGELDDGEREASGEDGDMSVICPYCNNSAEWVSNDRIYGRRYGKSYMVWLCEPCGAYVGCHQNTKRPLGTLANRELRRLRKQAHAVIDPFWKSGRMSRNEVYRRLANHFGVKALHVGQSDEDRCNGIIYEAPAVLSGD